MAHMELSGNIWRRHHDCKRLFVFINLRMKIFAVQPFLVEAFFNVRRIISLLKFFHVYLLLFLLAFVLLPMIYFFLIRKAHV